MSLPTLAEFLASPHNLCIYHGNERVFESSESDLLGLVRYLGTEPQRAADITIFDRYVGRAAAMLFIVAGASQVYAGVASTGGSRYLADHKIPLTAERTVPMLMDIASTEMCRWEKLSMDKSPQELLAALRDHYR